MKNLCVERIFEAVYKKLSGDLYNFLYYKYGNHDEIADVVQESFVKLWQNCKKVLPEKARGFLFKVAKNQMLNKFKHDKVVLNYQQKVTDKVEHRNPEYLLEEAQFYQKYQQALGKLTDEQRVAFLLNKVEGKKHKEIAEMLNVTQKVVEYRIYSAFKIIKKEIQELK